jgi:lysozyme family protein
VSFETALAKTLGFEGGVSDHAADRGGLTKAGVTQATYETWRAKTGQVPRPVLEMTDAELRAIYLDGYWFPAGCDKLPDHLAEVVFDMAVNSGPKRAVKTLQRSLGVEGDGVIGAITLAAARATGPDAVLAFLKARAALYRDIVKADPSQVAFLAGWISRLLDQAWRRA